MLTFEDLNQWFSQAHISPETCEDVPFGAEDENVNRLYSVVGGSLSSITVSYTHLSMIFRKMKEFFTNLNDIVTTC